MRGRRGEKGGEGERGEKTERQSLSRRKQEDKKKETYLSLGSKVFTDIFFASMELLELYIRKGEDCSAMASFKHSD